MNRGWPASVQCVQPGGGPVAMLARWWGAGRRALLRRLRPQHVARLLSQREAICSGCRHSVLDGRDLLWVQNVCGVRLPAALQIDPFRDRFGLVRLGRGDVLAATVIGGAAAVGVAAWSPWFAPLPLLLPAFAAWFFRDPVRTPPLGPDLALAPADGVLDDVRCEAENPFFAGPAWRLGIYLSLLSVHVNRAPVDGTAERFDYRRGRRIATARRGATDDNEQLVTWFRRAQGGEPVVVRQIAGPAARRICNVLGSGDVVAAGQRFGLIKFGSRTELWLPAAPGVELCVRQGERMTGGITVMARWRAP